MDGEHEVAADAFVTLSDPIRVAILRALWGAREPRSYSETTDAVGIRDCGRFNYHLGKLTGRFVRKSAAGYELRPAGVHAVNVVATGALPAGVDGRTTNLAGSCPTCGGALIGRYEAGAVTVDCGDCGLNVSWGTVPPRLAESRDVDDLLDAYGRRLRHEFALADEGVCSYCGGRVESRLEHHPGEAFGYLEHPAVNRFGGCEGRVYGPLGLQVASRPRVVAFCADNGIPAADRPYWEREWCVSEATVERAADGAGAARLTVPGDAENLVVTVDGHCRTVDVTLA